MSRWISYNDIISSVAKFKKAGGTDKSSEFNLFDTPGQKYFKIFFYFNNGDSEYHESPLESGGLLSPTWLNKKEVADNYYMYNSAWSYLKMNYDDERADLLEQFIVLLSNINNESPWYFSELIGLDAALERKQTIDRDFKFDEQRKKISIKCLQDSFDDRIGTLLDLYRSVAWSWTHKKEILPSNLRKFDMGIFIFEAPVLGFHMDYVFPFTSDIESYIDEVNNKVKNKKASNVLSDIKEAIDDDSKIGFSKISTDKPNIDTYKSSYKYIEFHNCEIDYNSSKGNYATLSNTIGFVPEYTIDIYFDDCYETRYNEFALREIGDFIIQDLYGIPDIKSTSIDKNDKNDLPNIISTNNYSTDEKIKQKLTDRIHYFEPDGKIKDNILKQLERTGKNIVHGFVNKIALGNLYKISPTRLAEQINSAKKGNVWAAVNTVEDYVEHFTSDKNDVKYVDHIGNIKNTGTNYNSSTTSNTKYVNKIGKLYEAQTIANNI